MNSIQNHWKRYPKDAALAESFYYAFKMCDMLVCQAGLTGSKPDRPRLLHQQNLILDGGEKHCYSSVCVGSNSLKILSLAVAVTVAAATVTNQWLISQDRLLRCCRRRLVFLNNPSLLRRSAVLIAPRPNDCGINNGQRSRNVFQQLLLNFPSSVLRML